jgi:hypothetical protein
MTYIYYLVTSNGACQVDRSLYTASWSNYRSVFVIPGQPVVFLPDTVHFVTSFNRKQCLASGRQFLYSTSTGKVKIPHCVITSAQHYSMKTDRGREGNALRIPSYLMSEYKYVLRLNIEFLLATSQ